MRLIPVAAIAVLLLAGCTSTEQPGPAPTVTVTLPAPSAEPAAKRNSETPIDAWDAYLTCRHAAIEFLGNSAYSTNQGNVDVASFEESDVVLRDDGRYYIYSETVVNVEEAPLPETAIECILGGTLGEIEYVSLGGMIRTPASERDPNQEILSED